MDYPGNFDIPVNPAGKRIAVSRIMAIWTLVAFLIAIFLCGILLWSWNSERLEPFMISANQDSGAWTIVGRSSDKLEYSATRTMQESVVGNFVKDWFKISKNNTENENAWKTCDRDVCISGNSLMFGDRGCAIYCHAGEDLYSRFSFNIIPDYQKRFQNGEFWEFDDASMLISPLGKISENGGTWQVIGTVISNTAGNFQIRAFLKIARNKNLYNQTMGFYVADFNSYQVDKK